MGRGAAGLQVRPRLEGGGGRKRESLSILEQMMEAVHDYEGTVVRLSRVFGGN
jgi:hypothetical protein